jgi:hypothetical protein
MLDERQRLLRCIFSYLQRTLIFRTLKPRQHCEQCHNVLNPAGSPTLLNLLIMLTLLTLLTLLILYRLDVGRESAPAPLLVLAPQAP